MGAMYSTKNASLLVKKCYSGLQFTICGYGQECHIDAMSSETSTMEPDLVVTLEPKTSECTRLSEKVEKFAEQNRLSPEVAYAIQLSLEEIVVNTMSYGCCKERAHTIQVRLRKTDETVEVEVEDDAAFFNPLEAALPDPLQGKMPEKEGGLGIFLVRKLMDDLKYRRTEKGNLLVMVKKL
jgi:anti-sigma regulatory factor (Ser/Thr protein kinase)